MTARHKHTPTAGTRPDSGRSWKEAVGGGVSAAPAGGFGTAVLALALLGLLVLSAVACLAGVGLLLAPAVLRALHALARRERARLSWHACSPGPRCVSSRPVRAPTSACGSPS